MDKMQVLQRKRTLKNRLHSCVLTEHYLILKKPLYNKSGMQPSRLEPYVEVSYFSNFYLNILHLFVRNNMGQNVFVFPRMA